TGGSAPVPIVPGLRRAAQSAKRGRQTGHPRREGRAYRGSGGTAFLWGRRREPPALCLRGWEPAGTSEETSHTSSTARARGPRPSQITIYGTAQVPRCVPRGCPEDAAGSSPAEPVLGLAKTAIN